MTSIASILKQNSINNNSINSFKTIINESGKFQLDSGCMVKNTYNLLI